MGGLPISLDTEHSTCARPQQCTSHRSSGYAILGSGSITATSQHEDEDMSYGQEVIPRNTDRYGVVCYLVSALFLRNRREFDR